MTAMAEPKLPPLASLRPDLPTPLLNAIAVGLEPDPERRTLEAAALCDVLRASGDLNTGRNDLVWTLTTLRQPGSASSPPQARTSSAAPAPASPGANEAGPIPMPTSAPIVRKTSKTPGWIIALLVVVSVLSIAAIVLVVFKVRMRSGTRSSWAATRAAPDDSASPGVGTVTVPPEKKGYPVWIDEHLVGESPGTFQVACGLHAVRIGSAGAAQRVSVPCGGDVGVK
jgi:hypothetical protein